MLTMREVLKNLDVLLVVIDESGEVIYSNRKYQAYLDIINKRQSGDFYVLSLSSWVRVNFKKFKNYYIISILDITDTKEQENKLRKQVFNDYLTGLVNRGGIADYLNEIISDFETTQEGFAVVMADLDLFKIINDTYGHQVGDDVLKEVSNILQKNLRNIDFVGRYGGEEFLIILKETNHNLIKESLERIRGRIEKFAFDHETDKLNLTMTFGVHVYDGTDNISDVIEKADQALYYGKRTGRNKVVVYDDIKG